MGGQGYRKVMSPVQTIKESHKVTFRSWDPVSRQALVEIQFRPGRGSRTPKVACTVRVGPRD